MVKLSKKEQQIIYAAAERIAKGMTECSCPAIAYSAETPVMGTQLCEKYCDFYLQPFGEYWLSDYYLPMVQKRNYRVMLLLWFAHVGAEGGL